MLRKEKTKALFVFGASCTVAHLVVTVSVVPFTSRPLRFTSSSLRNCAISCFFINHIQLNNAQNRTDHQRTTTKHATYKTQISLSLSNRVSLNSLHVCCVT